MSMLHLGRNNNITISSTIIGKEFLMLFHQLGQSFFKEVEILYINEFKACNILYTEIPSDGELFKTIDHYSRRYIKPAVTGFINRLKTLRKQEKYLIFYPLTGVSPLNYARVSDWNYSVRVILNYSLNGGEKKSYVSMGYEFVEDYPISVKQSNRDIFKEVT